MAERNGQTLGQRSFTGVLWTFLALFANQILNIISMAVLARKLTPYEFGIIGAAMLFVEFINIINNFGISSSLIQRKEVTKEHIYTAFTFSISVGVLLYIIMFFASHSAAEFFRIKELAPVLKVLSLNFIISSFYSVPKALLSRKMEFKFMATNNTISQLFGWTAVSITMAVMGFGYWSIVGGRIAYTLVSTIGILIKQPHSKKIAFNKTAFKDIVGFGSGISIQGILVYFAEQSDTVIVGRTLGAASLGIYNRSYSLMALFANFLSTSLSGVLLSTTSRIKQDTKRIAAAFEKLVKVSTILLMPVVTLVLVLSPEIIHIVLGKQWNQSIILFQILALGTFFRFGYSIGTSMTMAMGKLKSIITRQIIYLVLVICTVLIGIHYGLIGVAVAVFFCLFINYLICSLQIIKLVEYSMLSFFKAHFTGVKISLVVLLFSYGTAYLLRTVLSAPNFIIACITGIVTAGVLAMIYFAWPAFYGRQNIIMLMSLKDAALNKNKQVAISTKTLQTELLIEESILPVPGNELK